MILPKFVQVTWMKSLGSLIGLDYIWIKHHYIICLSIIKVRPSATKSWKAATGWSFCVRMVTTMGWLDKEDASFRRIADLSPIHFRKQSHIPMDQKMGVSKNRGTLKWMVYNGKPYIFLDDLGGKKPYLRKHPGFGFQGLAWICFGPNLRTTGPCTSHHLSKAICRKFAKFLLPSFRSW